MQYNGSEGRCLFCEIQKEGIHIVYICIIVIGMEDDTWLPLPAHKKICPHAKKRKLAKYVVTSYPLKDIISFVCKRKNESENFLYEVCRCKKAIVKLLYIETQRYLTCLWQRRRQSTSNAKFSCPTRCLYGNIAWLEKAKFLDKTLKQENIAMLCT